MNDSGMCNGGAISATVLPPEPFTGPYIAEVGSSAANARLIAAAPELLDALKACSFQLGLMVGAYRDFSDSNARAIDQAIAVIAKAEGR